MELFCFCYSYYGSSGCCDLNDELYVIIVQLWTREILCCMLQEHAKKIESLS